MASAYGATLVADVILDAGIVKLGTTPIGATRGGGTLTVEKTVAQVGFDGQRSPVVGLDRVTKVVARLRCAFLQFGEADVLKYEAQPQGALASLLGMPSLSWATFCAMSWATACALTDGVPGLVDPAGVLLPANRYLTDLRYEMTQGDGGTLTYVFPKATVVDTVPIKGTDGDAGEIALTIEARLDLTAVASTDVLPYTIEQSA